MTHPWQDSDVHDEYQGPKTGSRHIRMRHDGAQYKVEIICHRGKACLQEALDMLVMTGHGSLLYVITWPHAPSLTQADTVQRPSAATPPALL